MIRANVALDGRGGPVRDRFYERVMFPIFDAQGDCVAFGGRVIGTGEPKYLNSQETPLFHKSQVLYGSTRRRLAWPPPAAPSWWRATPTSSRCTRPGSPTWWPPWARRSPCGTSGCSPSTRPRRSSTCSTATRRVRRRPIAPWPSSARASPTRTATPWSFSAVTCRTTRIRPSSCKQKARKPWRRWWKGAAAHRVRPRAAPRQLRLGHGARPRSRAGRVPGGARPHQGHAGGEGLRRAHLVAPAGPWPSRHRGGRRAGAPGGPGGAPQRRRGGGRPRSFHVPARAARAFPGRAQPPALRARSFWPLACQHPLVGLAHADALAQVQWHEEVHRLLAERRAGDPLREPGRRTGRHRHEGDARHAPCCPQCSPPGRPIRRAPRRPSAPTWPRKLALGDAEEAIGALTAQMNAGADAEEVEASARRRHHPSDGRGRPPRRPSGPSRQLGRPSLSRRGRPWSPLFLSCMIVPLALGLTKVSPYEGVGECRPSVDFAGHPGQRGASASQCPKQLIRSQAPSELPGVAAAH